MTDPKSDAELKTIKFQMMLSPSEAEQIDDWMFKHRIRSRAEAIRRLCQIGMNFDKRADNLLSFMLASVGRALASGETITAARAKPDLSRRESELVSISMYVDFLDLLTDTINEVGLVWATSTPMRGKDGEIRELLERAEKLEKTLNPEGADRKTRLAELRILLSSMTPDNQ